MTIFLSTGDNSVVCFHYCLFLFPMSLKKAVTNPATKILHPRKTNVCVYEKAMCTATRAGPSRCGAQCKTWARGPMQDLSAGPLWAVILWRHRVQSTVLGSWLSAKMQYSS